MFKYEFPGLVYRFSPSVGEYRTLGTKALREAFLLDELFIPGTISLVATDLDRAIVGGICPTSEPLKLGAAEELRCRYFFERREGGFINVGGAGRIIVDGETFEVGKGECLYVGRETSEVVCEFLDTADPAAFYLLSYPAHKRYPTSFADRSLARRIELGSGETCNERTIFQYIHEEGIQSCQLVMGVTQLESGSVWNTMPCHTHFRRSEVYLYFDLNEDDQVAHFLGQPDESRVMWVKNKQAALSPSWSIHSGSGTASYSFIWGMGGENQRFDDMDGVSVRDLK